MQTRTSVHGLLNITAIHAEDKDPETGTVTAMGSLMLFHKYCLHHRIEL